VLESPATDLVHALKYEGWQELAGFMANAMSRLHGAAGGEGVVVVPVPTTASRLATRGYNQAALLARHVSETLGVPLRDALRRRAGGGSQTSLTPSERRENVCLVRRPAPSSPWAEGTSFSSMTSSPPERRLETRPGRWTPRARPPSP
jgi:predicted amidophosphoribosyltransferase